MKLLIAYDGSAHATAAIRNLHRAGMPRLATALVVSVGEAPASSIGTPSLDPTIARRTGTMLEQTRADTALSLAGAEQLAQEGAALVSGGFAGWEVSTQVRLGKPAEVIIDTDSAWGADLIVVGAQGRSALGRLLMGSVSQAVATRSERSVLVSRYVGDRGNKPVRIVIGIDGSPDSGGAVEAVAKRNWKDDTEVHVVAVAGTYRSTDVAKRIPTAAAWIDERNQSGRETAKAALDDAMRLLSATGLRTSEHFAEGAAQTILNDHTTRFDADCLFVSGRTFSGDLAVGTADAINALVTSAPCSVEIVR
jgi:nucleotide-binding universal stress UspA family protein